MGMTPPIDQFRERQPSGGCCADQRQRVPHVAGVSAPRRWCLNGHWLLAGGRLAADALDDQRRLQLAQELCVLLERLCELPGKTPAVSGLLGQAVQPLGAALNRPICSSRHGHFLVGGSSPVTVRQTREAVRRAAIVAAALNPAYRPVQSALRSIPDLLTNWIRKR
jgi:hypothetical protein